MTPTDQAKFLDFLRSALAVARPYQLDLTDAERRSMAPQAMGRESVPFAREARALLTSHPEVLRRTITDAIITNYPVLLQTVEESDEALELLTTLLDLIDTRRLAGGVAVMSVARPAYRDGQNDKGRTPGVSTIIDRMSERFGHDGPTNADTDSTEPQG